MDAEQIAAGRARWQQRYANSRIAERDFSTLSGSEVEPVYGPALSVWPGTEGGPPVLLGAWRSERSVAGTGICVGIAGSGRPVSPSPQTTQKTACADVRAGAKGCR